MDFLLLLKAIVMGVVEGLTEFLPISSTGHLILAGSLLNFHGDKAQVFEIFIQIGAILAVCWEYRARLSALITGLPHDVEAQRFAFNIFLAFLPLALIGLAFGKTIKAVLFHPIPVAIAFIVGGVIILWLEKRQQNSALPARITQLSQLTWHDAIKLGFAQACALIPGTSRSGATIIGGMWFGLSRQTATEFSFFLAIPTLICAGLYDLYKHRALLELADISLFGVGLLASFISAFFCVRWLLRYISTHNFVVFAWYRIVFGGVILWTAYSGTIAWVK